VHSTAPIEYDPLIEKPIAKRLLAIGSPRSGTRFLTNLLNKFGLRVRHERMGEDGTVNPAWLAMRMKNDPLIQCTGRQHYEFDQIVHIVRHPLAVIRSLSLEMSEVWWKWQEVHSHLEVSDPSDLEKTAAFWVFWTDGCQHLCDTHIRLEDISHLGDPTGKGVKPEGRIVGSDLGAMEETVAQRCETYGYKL
jgi:hypothetical protein